MFDYKAILPGFVSNGQPATDTINKYFYEIDKWLEYCHDNDYDPIKDITEQDAADYIQFLTSKNYKPASINIKVAAIKMFYFVAERLKVRTDNPFSLLKAKAVAYDDADFNYLTPADLKNLCNSIINSNSKNITIKRNLAIVMFMAVEGLRTVEVHRMSLQDFNHRNKSLLVHGKGRDAYIYPCDDTFNVFDAYLKSLSNVTVYDDKDGTPAFISLAVKTYGERITRTGIRFAINHVLESSIDRKKGDSCHMLRHSCGTNLYAETKDLRLVQETLRQRNPSTTARYAHVNDRINDRQTANISPVKDLDIDLL